jgi:Tol biopolymer transport system component
MTRVFPNPGQIGAFIANADGSDERPLISPADFDYDAVLSPDGQAIVFTSERSGSADLYRVRSDGSGLEQLTNDPAYDDQAAFSPDGHRLVFVSTRGDRTADLFTLDLTTKKASQLTSGPGGDFRPSWSPDGNWIAFSSDRASSFPFARGRWERLHVAEIYVVRPDGTGLRRVIAHNDTTFCGSPKWTSDSKRVIAHCMTAEQTLANRRPAPDQVEDSRIVSIDVATGATAELSVGHGVNFNPSPLAGDVVGFIRKDGPERGIRYSDGRRGPGGDVRAASWSPDRRRVVFHRRLTAQRSPWAKAWSRDPRYTLTFTAGGPSFSPTGDRYAYVGPAPNAMGAGILVAHAGGDSIRVI